MDSADFAYCAGIIDGEGSICYSRHRPDSKGRTYPNLELIVTNTNIPLLKMLEERFGGKFSCHQSARYKIGKTNYLSAKPTYRWRLTGRKAVALLLRILPWLIVKREKAEISLAAAAVIWPQYGLSRGKQLCPTFE